MDGKLEALALSGQYFFVGFVMHGAVMFAVACAGEARSRMELRHLRYLVAVADAGTFVAASQQIRVAQPALTRQLQDLATELGAELFEKGARKATLTLAGEACVRIARHVMQDTEQAIQRARMSSEGLVGACHVIAGPLLFSSGFVGRLVARMRGKYPGIEVVVMEAEATSLWDALVEGAADVGLSMPAPSSYPSLVAETQFVDVVEHVVVHPNHPLSSRTEVSIEELRGHQFLSLNGVGIIEEINRNFHQELSRRGIDPAKVRELTSFNSVLAHVRAGQGWTMLPNSIRGSFAPLVAIRIADFRAPFPVARLWRRTEDRAVIRTVLSELREMEREERGGADTPPGGTKRQRSAGAGIPARLELRHLRSYEQVAQHGSFGRAAEALGITQPALSRQMKDLEFDVGVALFARGTRGVDLTNAGREFLDNARDVLAVAARLNKEARRAEREVAQRCVIAVVPHPIVDQLVADAVAELESRPNRLRLGTRMLGTPSMPDALERSEIDLGICFTYPARVPPLPHLARIPLYDDELNHAMLAPGHQLAKAKSLSLADLTDVPFLFPARETFPPVYDVVMHQFSLAAIRPRTDASYEGVLTIWAIAAQGLGWALGLRQQASAPPMGLVSIPLRDFSLPWGGELIYRRDESREPILAVIDCILDRAFELYGKGS